MICEEFFTSVNNQDCLIEKTNKEIPVEYVPTEEEIYFPLDLKIKNDQDNGNVNENSSIQKDQNEKRNTKKRMIFYSSSLENYSDEEKLLIDDLVNGLKNNTKLNKVLEKDPSAIFDMFRFFTINSYDLKSTQENIMEYLNIFIDGGFSSNKRYLKLIKMGFIYIQGRDKNYRPNIVFDINRFLDYSEKMEYSDFMRSFIFVLEFVIKFCFVRGKVETWNFILNLDINKNFEPQIFKLKYFYSQIVPLIKKFYPFRTNDIFLFLRTEEFYLRSSTINKESNTEEAQDTLIFDFFKDFISPEVITNIYIIDHELSNFYTKIVNKYSLRSLTLIELFNEHISKDSMEEKYFGNCSNIKEFFDFVNNPGNLSISNYAKRDSVKSISETSEYDSVRSIKDKDVSVYDEADANLIIERESSPKKYLIVKDSDKIDNEEYYSPKINAINPIASDKFEHIIYSSKPILSTEEEENVEYQICQDETGFDKPELIQISNQHINNNSSNKVLSTNCNTIQTQGENSNVLMSSMSSLQPLETIDYMSNTGSNFVPKARGGRVEINQSTPQNDKEGVIMESEETFKNRGGCCTGKCIIF